MIRHIVSWRLAAEDEAGKNAQAAEITAALETLPALIPEIRSFTIGRNVVADERNFDLVLIADYASAADLEAYVVHPEHQKVAAIVTARVSARACVDIEA